MSRYSFKTSKNLTGSIALGEAYYYDPEKLAAFLVWLLDSGAKPQELIRSNLLQQCFKIHGSPSDENVRLLHDLLNALGKENEKVKALYDLAMQTPCGVRGLVNDSKRGEPGYSSINVLGSMVAHAEKVSDEQVNADGKCLTHFLRCVLKVPMKTR